jgi:hypothetical protein
VSSSSIRLGCHHGAWIIACEPKGNEDDRCRRKAEGGLGNALVKIGSRKKIAKSAQAVVGKTHMGNFSRHLAPTVNTVSGHNEDMVRRAIYFEL